MVNFIINLAKRKSADGSEAQIRNLCGTYDGVLGILFNLFLCATKITVGALCASISIVADGLNNLSDMGSSVVTLLGFKLAAKPADSDHPYGHGRMEYISSFIVSALIVFIGFELLKESATAVFSGQDMPKYTLWSVIVLAFSVLLKFVMFLFNNRLGKKINSETLKTTAKDSINDCITTSVLLIAILVSNIFDLTFNLDAVLGIGVAIFIIFSGVMSSRTTFNTILGRPPEPKIIEEIKEIILSFDMFVGIHDLMVHSYGPSRLFASVHVEVPENVDVVVCHEKIDICEKLVNERLGVELVIHMDPIATDNEEIHSVQNALCNALISLHPDLSLHDFRMTPKGDSHINLIFDVVVPSSVNTPQNVLRNKIISVAKSINPCFECIITFDNDYTGR